MTMITEYLNDLTKVDGIDGIAIYDKNNRVLDSWCVPHFNTKIFNDIGINYLQIFAAVYGAGKEAHEVGVAYEKGQIYARIFPNFFLVVISKVKVEISLIRLIVNVGVSDLIGSKKIQKTTAVPTFLERTVCNLL